MEMLYFGGRMPACNSGADKPINAPIRSRQKYGMGDRTYRLSYASPTRTKSDLHFAPLTTAMMGYLRFPLHRPQTPILVSNTVQAPGCQLHIVSSDVGNSGPRSFEKKE